MKYNIAVQYFGQKFTSKLRKCLSLDRNMFVYITNKTFPNYIEPKRANIVRLTQAVVLSLKKCKNHVSGTSLLEKTQIVLKKIVSVRNARNVVPWTSCSVGSLLTLHFSLVHLHWKIFELKKAGSMKESNTLSRSCFVIFHCV